jgi:cytochrome b pre-mRNA-processing protein 3
MWLVLRRLKEERKEGTQFGQYLYEIEIYNHDLEQRAAKAGYLFLLLVIKFLNTC